MPYGPPDPSARATRSDVPALITDGRLDPFGTFEASQALAAGFSNGQMVLFPYAGVMPITNDLGGCGGDVLRDFLANPMAPLDTGCVQDSQPPRFLTEYRRTSAPGRLLIGLSAGTYPIVPALIAMSLALPLLVMPIVWLVRRLRRKTTGGKAVPLVELVSWLAAATALGAIAHLARALLAWAGDHPVALPAAVPPTVIISAGIAAGAGLLAVVALGLTFRSPRKPERKMSRLLAAWVAVATVCSFLWIIWMI